MEKWLDMSNWYNTFEFCYEVENGLMNLREISFDAKHGKIFFEANNTHWSQMWLRVHVNVHGKNS